MWQANRGNIKAAAREAETDVSESDAKETLLEVRVALDESDFHTTCLEMWSLPFVAMILMYFEMSISCSQAIVTTSPSTIPLLLFLHSFLRAEHTCMHARRNPRSYGRWC
jgi:hypothetical protein